MGRWLRGTAVLLTLWAAGQVAAAGQVPARGSDVLMVPRWTAGVGLYRPAGLEGVPPGFYWAGMGIEASTPGESSSFRSSTALGIDPSAGVRAFSLGLAGGQRHLFGGVALVSSHRELWLQARAEPPLQVMARASRAWAAGRLARGVSVWFASPHFEPALAALGSQEPAGRFLDGQRLQGTHGAAFAFRYRTGPLLRYEAAVEWAGLSSEMPRIDHPGLGYGGQLRAIWQLAGVSAGFGAGARWRPQIADRVVPIAVASVTLGSRRRPGGGPARASFNLEAVYDLTRPEAGSTSYAPLLATASLGLPAGNGRQLYVAARYPPASPPGCQAPGTPNGPDLLVGATLSPSPGAFTDLELAVTCSGLEPVVGFRVLRAW